MNDLLVEQIREAARARKLCRKTADAYINHLRRFFQFGGRGGEGDKSRNLIGAYLNYLENDCNFAPSTVKQAACALVFFYRELYGRQISNDFKRQTKRRDERQETVIFSKDEIRRILSNLSGAPYLIAALIYGSGLRLNEALQLRVGDFDFERREIFVRRPNSVVKDRVTILPESITARLKNHLLQVKYLHEDDCLRGYGKTRLPLDDAATAPGEAYRWRRQFAFPAVKLSADETNGGFYRWHLAESTVQKAVGEAIRKARIGKKANCRNLRHSFAFSLVEKKHDIYTVGNLLGHKNLRSTLRYMRMESRPKNVIASPLDT